jgi:hypothetical protein
MSKTNELPVLLQVSVPRFAVRHWRRVGSFDDSYMYVSAFARSLRGICRVACPDSVCRSYWAGNVAGHAVFHPNARATTDYAGRSPFAKRQLRYGRD